jgi:pimeloyl-ACP methyl ester carboxylesterase
MLYATLWIVAALAVLLVLRWWQLHRVGPAPRVEPFDGDVYRIGEGAVVVREVPDPSASVVVMPGFLEDFRYFAEYYADPRIQLIGVVSGDYHLPVSGARHRSAGWAHEPSSPVGTIRHDAEVLCQALENLATAGRIRVHGHSRGGAVVAEASSLCPDLFKGVEAILEAPVLPGGTPYRPLPGPALWLLPLVMPLWRLMPINRLNVGAWGRLDIPRKRELIEQLPFGPRRISTMIRNLRDMEEWMAHRGESVYQGLRQGAVIVPDYDRVLTPADMEASARRADGLDVIRVEQCSHFVIFDRPDVLPPLMDAQGRAAADSHGRR